LTNITRIRQNNLRKVSVVEHVRKKMNILKTMKDRTGNIIVSAALLLAVTLPGFISTYASAAQITSRSIALSSSSADASGVTYQVNFTAPSAGGAFAVLFCDSASGPLAGTSCTAPTGFSTASAASTSSGVTGVTHPGANYFIVADAYSAASVLSIDVTGIHNPTSAGPLYARISTYATTGNATTDMAATGTSQGVLGVDNGGVAISITNTIGVSGAVLESLTFCISGASIANADCATTTAPVLKLGETVGSTVALVPGTISTGNLYTVISTNAASGAVVNLKSSTLGCGGLVRVGVANCDIKPALAAGITTSDAKFGVKAAAGTDPVLSGAGATTPSGAFTTLGSYNGTTYAMNWITGDGTGVTSTYGDPFLTTSGAPANAKQMQLTFGVGVTNQTPAGLYSADLGLIATGTF
jgi:hypothetical protein